MKSRAEAIQEIFERHGTEAIYVASTGYVARAAHAESPKKHQVFYMNGSMGLAPGIGLGLALNTTQEVVVISGDASLLMHLGLTHTIRDFGPENLRMYILDNNCHESVGSHSCVPLEQSYPGVDEIMPISKDGKTPRVSVTFDVNARQIQAFVASSRG